MSLLFFGCEKMLLGPGSENTPAGNFDVLWKTIDEKYGQFPVKDVNWDSLYNIYSKQITPLSTENELWNISSQLLAPLNDAHIALFNRGYTAWYTQWNIDFERRKGFTHVAQLPNGWTLNYPCTLSTTPAGKSPEGIGIIPDIAIENTKADVLAGNDKVLEYANKHLLK